MIRPGRFFGWTPARERKFLRLFLRDMRERLFMMWNLRFRLSMEWILAQSCHLAQLQQEGNCAERSFFGSYAIKNNMSRYTRTGVMEHIRQSERGFDSALTARAGSFRLD